MPRERVAGRVLPRVSRAVDRFVSRGAGLDARGDPYGPPLRPDEAARLLEAVRSARFPREASSPFASPVPLDDTAPRVPVVLRPPPRAGDAWAVVAHPYGAFARPGRLGLYALHATTLGHEGFGVAAPELPYHGARALAGMPSGWGFVRADLGLTARAIAASAAEVAALARWLREAKGARRVVGLGISLGGAALGLAAALGAPFERVAFLAAVDNPAAFYATGENRAARRRTLAAHGVGPEETRAAFAPVAPSSHAAPSAEARWFVPSLDGVVPAEAQRAWRDAWGGGLEELPGHGHAVALADPLVARRIARWLARDSVLRT